MLMLLSLAALTLLAVYAHRRRVIRRHLPARA
jgi:hypothetical protein